MSTPRLTFYGRVMVVVEAVIVATMMGLAMYSDAVKGDPFPGWKWVEMVLGITFVGILAWFAVFQPDLDLQDPLTK